MTEVGTVFASLSEARDTIKLENLSEGYQIKRGYTKKERCSLICAVPNCKWSVTIKTCGPVATVTRHSNEHTCGASERCSHGTAGILAKGPEFGTAARGKELNEAHPHVSLRTIYRAKQKADEEKTGRPQDSYSLLRDYLEQLKETNPGTVSVVREKDGTFDRMFFALGASVHASKYCLPIVFVDGTHLTGHVTGVLLLASALDAKGQIVPLCLAQVDSESTDTWGFFLRHLRETFAFTKSCTLLSDRAKGLAKAEELFENCLMCINHLVSNSKDIAGISDLKERIWNLCTQKDKERFHSLLSELKSENKKLGSYLEGIPPKKWVDAFLQTPRFGHYTQNVAESLNSRLLEARRYCPVEMLEGWRRMLQEWWGTRGTSTGCPTDPVDPIRKRVLGNQRASALWKVRRCEANKWEVKKRLTDTQAFLANTRANTCTCLGPQLDGFPCVHLCCALKEENKPLNSAVNKYFQNVNYQKTYAKGILPPKTSTFTHDSLLPPIQEKLPTGRPRKVKRVGKGTKKCSRCGRTGHQGVRGKKVICRQVPLEGFTPLYARANPISSSSEGDKNNLKALKRKRNSSSASCCSSSSTSSSSSSTSTEPQQPKRKPKKQKK